MQVIEYLERKGIQFKRRGEELLFNCPFCQDKEWKASINAVTGLYNCLHLNNCGLSGNFYDFQKRLGDEPEKPEYKQPFIKTRKKNYVRPKTIVPAAEPKEPAYLYLKKRGFTDETIKEFKLGTKQDTVMFPFYKNGQLVNIKYRNIKDKAKMWQEKEAEPVLFNRDNMTDDILLIVEGEYDCIALQQYGIQSVSIPNGANSLQWIDHEWEYLETFRHIKLLYDQDEAGREGALKAATALGMWRCSLIELPYKDANECLLKGVSANEIAQFINRPKELSPETIVEPSFFAEKIKRIFRQGAESFGTPTAWESLTNLLKGWRDGETTIWTGKQSSGKSTMLNQHVIDLASRGIKTCIYSGEMPPERYLRWAIIQFKQNNSPSERAIQDALYWMDEKIYILNVSTGIEIDKLFSDFEYAARRHNVKHFIIDSLMKVGIPSKDEYNQQKEFMSSLCDFAKQFNTHMHLVAHPRKTASDSDVPGKVDVKGSSHLTDLADNVIVLFRPEFETMENARNKGKKVSDVIVHVKKNREFGIEGKVLMSFDANTKRFKETI